MSFLAPSNLWFSLIGLAVGAVGGYVAGSQLADGELLWPFTLVGGLGGFILGGFVRVVLRK